MEDTLWAGLTDELVKLPMAITAENLAEKYGISRLDADEFALQSQQRWHHGRVLLLVTLKTSSLYCDCHGKVYW